jgi:hypothetical protein
MARPSILTPSVIEELGRAIEEGVRSEVAGVSRRSVRRAIISYSKRC